MKRKVKHILDTRPEDLQDHYSLRQKRMKLSSSQQLEADLASLSGKLSPAHREELEQIWAYDRRVPSLLSRKAWSLARGVEPKFVSAWFSRKRYNAVRKTGIILPTGTYELDLKAPLSSPKREQPFPRRGAGNQEDQAGLKIKREHIATSLSLLPPSVVESLIKVPIAPMKSRKARNFQAVKHTRAHVSAPHLLCPDCSWNIDLGEQPTAASPVSFKNDDNTIGSPRLSTPGLTLGQPSSDCNFELSTPQPSDDENDTRPSGGPPLEDSGPVPIKNLTSAKGTSSQSTTSRGHELLRIPYAYSQPKRTSLESTSHVLALGALISHPGTARQRNDSASLIKGRLTPDRLGPRAPPCAAPSSTIRSSPDRPAPPRSAPSVPAVTVNHLPIDTSLHTSPTSTCSGQRDAYTQLTRKVHPLQKPSLSKNDTSVQGTRLAAPLDSRHHSASLQSLQANKSSESPSARTMTESNVQNTHSLDPPQSVVNTTLRDHLIRSIKPRKRAPPNRAAMNGHPPHDGARVGPSLAVKLELIDVSLASTMPTRPDGKENIPPSDLPKIDVKLEIKNMPPRTAKRKYKKATIKKEPGSRSRRRILRRVSRTILLDPAITHSRPLTNALRSPGGSSRKKAEKKTMPPFSPGTAFVLENSQSISKLPKLASKSLATPRAHDAALPSTFAQKTPTKRYARKRISQAGGDLTGKIPSLLEGIFTSVAGTKRRRSIPTSPFNLTSDTLVNSNSLPPSSEVEDDTPKRFHPPRIYHYQDSDLDMFNEVPWDSTYEGDPSPWKLSAIPWLACSDGYGEVEQL